MRKEYAGASFPRPLAGAVAKAAGTSAFSASVSSTVGERMYAGNAAGCSSAISGGAPILPYCRDEQGRGPAWEHSLFEDNAEFAYGFFHAQDAIRKELLFRFWAQTWSMPPKPMS